MSCSPFDLRDYFLQELPDKDRRQVEAHVRNCLPCREELDRLGMTQAALFSLRDEEIPQRVSFVSDAIFEPSPWRRAWTGLWNSAARLGFASAAMLSAALVVYSVTRPAPAAQTVVASQTVKAVATIPASLSDAEIQARVDAAVAKAVAASEEQQMVKARQLVAELESYKRTLQAAAADYDLDLRRNGGVRAAAYRSEESQ
jgi:anti-sigma factor RsiW